ncbi:MAG: glycosyltransferase [Clostridia bacterium]|nr:glycosyltransferase [Clostridia bacterium]MDD4047711.1 glycosyltransferase [Clostridia bacterium]
MKLKVLGSVDGVTGYGEVIRQIILALHELGVNLWVQPQNCGCTHIKISPEIDRLLTILKLEKKYEGCFYVNVPSFFRVNMEKPSIGLTMSEADGICHGWVNCCNRLERILVPSRFNYETFRQSGVKENKLRILPLGVDFKHFTPEGKKLIPKELDSDSMFTFLSIGEWLPRKGFDILLKAYVQEFSLQDDVCLILKCYSNNSDYDLVGTRIGKEISAIIKNEKKINPPSVILLPQTLSSREMPSLYRGVNCFVLATHGEGWNMPAFEALACGVPVITTNWSAHADYLNDGIAYLIEIEGIKPIPAYGLSVDEIYLGNRWAQPSMEHLRSLMRSVYENYEQAKRKANKGMKMIRANLSWEECGRGVIRHFTEIMQNK